MIYGIEERWNNEEKTKRLLKRDGRDGRARSKRWKRENQQRNVARKNSGGGEEAENKARRV